MDDRIYHLKKELWEMEEENGSMRASLEEAEERLKNLVVEKMKEKQVRS